MSAADVSTDQTIGTGLREDAARFDHALARELVEFAVDLDAQDDRLRLERRAQASSTIADLRANASPLSEFYFPQYRGRWDIRIDRRIQYADGASRGSICEPSWDGADPNYSGFGPFANAWILARDIRPFWRPVGTDLPAYVVAIRETVFSSPPSVVEDLFANTVAARRLIRDAAGSKVPMVFAERPEAEIHAGFGYACLSLLF